MKKILSLAVAATISMAGQAWYQIGEYTKEVKSNVIPYQKNKDKLIIFGHFCVEPNYKNPKYYRIKTIIWQVYGKKILVCY